MTAGLLYSRQRVKVRLLGYSTVSEGQVLGYSTVIEGQVLGTLQ